MSKIDEMSLSEIFQEIGIKVDERDMYNILGRDSEIFNQWREVLSRRLKEQQDKERRISELSIEKDGISGDIVKKMFNIKDRQNEISLTADDFLAFEGQINKYYLVLLTLYNWQKSLEQNHDGQSKDEIKKVKANIKRTIKLIGEEDFDVTDIIYEDGYAKRITAINSQELISVIRKSRRLAELQKPDEEKQRRIERIDDEIGLDNIVNVLIERDFQEGLTRNETVGCAIADQILFNGVKDYQKSHPDIEVWEGLYKEEEEEQEANASGEGADSKTEGKKEKSLKEKVYESKAYKNSVKDAILANYQYLDIDMLLLIAAFRYLEALEFNMERIKFEHSTEDGKIEISEEDVVLIIQDVVTRIWQAIEGDPEFEVQYAENKIVGYSKDELKKDLRRFHEGRYIKKSETENAKASLMANEMTFLGIEDAVLRTMDLTDEEFQVLIQNSEENVIYLINYGVIEKDEIMGALYARKTCSEALFFTAYQKGLLDDKDIIRLFEDKKIDGEIIAKIEDKEIREKISGYAKLALKESYLVVTLNKDAKPEELEMFVRSIVLYKKLCMEGRTEEEIANNSNELVSSFEDNINSEILQELYQFGIISLDVAADWGVDLTEMLASNSIKPTDLKNLYAKKVVSIDEIKNVLINGSLTYEEKLDLIYSTFDGESQEEALAREELTEFLGLGESYKSEERGTGRQRGIGNGTRNKEFITEPHTRWKLLSLLDKDYSKGCLPEGRKVIDGHRVFLLPNHNKVVIERMHEKRNGKRVSAYGNATYIMGIEEFYKSIDDIIIDGAINRTYLREAQEDGQATKIIHSKHWGNSIKRQFGVNTQSSRYTQEEIKVIDEAIKNVENSRKERE